MNLGKQFKAITMTTSSEQRTTNPYPEQITLLARAETEPTQIAQANRPANLPSGYDPNSDYSVRITPQGIQFVRESDNKIYQNRTFTPQQGLLATDGQGNTTNIAVQSRSGQIRTIPAGTPLSINNLRDGDRIYFPERQQTRQAPPPQPATAVDLFRLALQSNALNQLSLSRDRLTTELAQYQAPNSPAWETLRQIAAKDQQLKNAQVQAVDAFTSVVSIFS